MTNRPADSSAGGRLEHTFLVRLWRDRAGGEWLGQVTHIQTGRRHAFRRLHDLLAPIEAAAAGLGDDPPPAPGDLAGRKDWKPGEEPDSNPG